MILECPVCSSIYPPPMEFCPVCENLLEVIEEDNNQLKLEDLW